MAETGREPGAEAVTEDRIAALGALLDRERDALLDGDFDTIERLAAERERLVAALAAAPPAEAGALAPLQARLRRNRDLFEQALAGLRSVGDRLAALRRLREGAETYDDGGARQTLAAPRRQRLERRA
ncbi:flagellar protein FlgN [Roseivivax sp. CAU 1761]